MRLTRFEFDREHWLTGLLTQSIGVDQMAARGRLESRIRVLRNPESTREELAYAIEVYCDSCRKKTLDLVQMPDDGGGFLYLCADCLRAALALLESKP